MKIAIGADHAGYLLKQRLLEKMSLEGHDVTDFGTGNTDSVDYPDLASAVAHDVVSGHSEKGILVCSTGVGMSIAANKINGIRAALGVNAEEVELTRRHNDANVLAIGAKFSTPEVAEQLVDVFLRTGFDGGRHERRLQKITALETK
jgi:ribose 5-phosphate isomerase B